jgi:hypothetical protein
MQLLNRSTAHALNQTSAQSQRRSSFLGGFFDNLFGSDYGDSLETAENVGRLKRGRSYNYSGDVGRRDLDFFRFRTRKRNALNITFTNDRDNSNPIAISMLNRQGQVVKTGDEFLFKNVNVGETSTLFINRLRKGTYFFRIQSAEGRNEDYDLNFSLSAPSTSAPGSALTIGRLSPNQNYRFTGQVGGSDIDFYKFNVDTTSRFSTSLFNNNLSSGFSNNSIAFSVLDDRQLPVRTGNGRFLFANVFPSRVETLFDPTLPPGDYYLRVQSDVGRDLTYQLSLSRSNLVGTPI